MSEVKAATVRQSKLAGELRLLFLFWPFLSFIIALRNFGDRQARKVVIAFFAFFGFTLNLTRESMDGFKHAKQFAEFNKMDYDAFSTVVYNYFTKLGGSDTLDIYTLVVNFLISRFTDSYHFVFLFHALLYAVFSVKLFGFLYDEFEEGLNKNSRLFFVLLFFLLPINNVHGVRFPIATVLYVYGTYQYLRTEDRKHLIWCGGAVLVHFSFVLAFALNAAFSLLGNRNKIYLAILGLSYVAPGLFASYLTSFQTGIGEGVEEKIAGYTRDEYIKARNAAIEGRNWYAKYRIPLLQYTLYAVIFVINFVQKRRFEHDRLQENLLSFMILLLAFVNFGMSIDSLGNRFLIIWFVFAAIFLFRFFQLNYSPTFDKFTIVLAFPVVLWMVVQTRVAFYITSYMWFIGNPITAYFIEMKPILN